MAEIITRLNQISEIWFRIIALNSLQLVILFVILFGITGLFRKKSSVFLYSVWSLFLLKAVLLPVIRLPFLQRYHIPVMSLNPVLLDSSPIRISSESIAAASLSIQSILLILWILGILFLILLYFRNEHLFFSSLKHAQIYPDKKIPQKLTTQLRINKPIGLQLSPNVPAPFTRGFRKPVIYLPQSALQWTDQQLNHVLCHELAHIQRKDILIISFQNILNLLYFFHPLVWLANHQINFQREKICDDTAIAVLNENPTRYGRTLMDNLESFLVHRRLPLIANGLFFSRRTIVRRFEYLLNRGKEIKMKLGLFQKTVLVLLAVFVIITAGVSQTEILPPPPPPVPQEKLPPPEPPAEGAEFIAFDTPPEPIGGFKMVQQNLVYPPSDKAAGNEGTVIVQVFITEKGDVIKPVIMRSPGIKSLEEAAIKAITKTKFKPAILNDKPVGVNITIPIIFKLDNDKSSESAQLQKYAGPEFVAYDSPPEPIGGFKSIQKNIVLPKKGMIDGKTVVRTFIDIDGNATQLSIEQSCGNKAYDKAAIAAIEKTEFIPAKQRDKTIGVWIMIPVVFKP